MTKIIWVSIDCTGLHKLYCQSASAVIVTLYVTVHLLFELDFYCIYKCPEIKKIVFILNSHALSRLTSGPYFSFFSVLVDPDPYFPLLFKKTALLSLLFGGCHVVNLNKKTLKTSLYTDFQHKIYLFVDKKPLTASKMYIVVQFKLPF